MKSVPVPIVSPSICHEVMGPDAMILALGQEDPLEEGLAGYSSIPAWEIPWTEEPGPFALLPSGPEGWGHPWGETGAWGTVRTLIHGSQIRGFYQPNIDLLLVLWSVSPSLLHACCC